MCLHCTVVTPSINCLITFTAGSFLCSSSPHTLLQRLLLYQLSKLISCMNLFWHVFKSMFLECVTTFSSENYLNIHVPSDMLSTEDFSPHLLYMSPLQRELFLEPPAQHSFCNFSFLLFLFYLALYHWYLAVFRLICLLFNYLHSLTKIAFPFRKSNCLNNHIYFSSKNCIGCYWCFDS